MLVSVRVENPRYLLHPIRIIILLELIIRIASLEKLGEKLTTEGPHKSEYTSRRIRGLLGGKFIFDTTAAKYVWEHPYCPFYLSIFYLQSLFSFIT